WGSSCGGQGDAIGTCPARLGPAPRPPAWSNPTRRDHPVARRL
ncbi:MAG: hypothetical protein AVDCRST_MAG69-799, partial [uncultured Solirubrobacteraceae bacterium]